jgi:hypothetical protein
VMTKVRPPTAKIVVNIINRIRTRNVILIPVNHHGTIKVTEIFTGDPNIALKEVEAFRRHNALYRFSHGWFVCDLPRHVNVYIQLLKRLQLVVGYPAWI